LHGKLWCERGYTRQEQKLLFLDIHRILRDALQMPCSFSREAIFTAGAPGAGKSKLMEDYLAREKEKLHISCYFIDPASTLHYLSRTYKSEIVNRTAGEQTVQEIKRGRAEVYQKWRPAADVVSVLLLLKMVELGRRFAYSSTTNTSLVVHVFEWLRYKHYSIEVIHLTTLEKVRYLSLEERCTLEISSYPQLQAAESKMMLKETPEEIQRQGRLFHETIRVYLSCDVVHFFFRSSIVKRALLAATWSRGGLLQVRNQRAYAELVVEHDRVCKDLPDGENLTWENVMRPATALL